MKSKTLFTVVLVLVAGLVVTDQLFLQKRGIASFSRGMQKVNKTTTYFDLTDIPESEFNLGFKTALISGLSVQKIQNTLQLTWGHFLTTNDSGGKVYACQKYPFIELELKADGVAASGEIPSIVIRGPCLTSDDSKKILPLPIPLQGLIEKLRTQPELKLSLGNGGSDAAEGFTISARHLVGPGARFWNVTNLKLYNETESVSVDGYEIISLLDQPLTLDFAVTQ